MKVFAANWKMNKSPDEARSFFKELLPFVPKEKTQDQVLIFPMSLCAESVAAEVLSLSSKNIYWGAQNISSEKEGAFTGEVSAYVLKKMGASFALIGHSERRTLFQETNQFLNLKVKMALQQGLVPMLCLGESLQQRDDGVTEKVLETQLEESLQGIDPKQQIYIAYEPVWAIGTGRVAMPEQVQQAHAWIRQWLNQKGYSKQTPVLYGGSVKPENAKELLMVPNVDGFLVGGAALQAASFAKICGWSVE
jgi:triosephosphate isomerase